MLLPELHCPEVTWWADCGMSVMSDDLAPLDNESSEDESETVRWLPRQTTVAWFEIALPQCWGRGTLSDSWSVPHGPLFGSTNRHFSTYCTTNRLYNKAKQFNTDGSDDIHSFDILYSLSLSLSLTHTHTHTHTCICTLVTSACLWPSSST